MFRFGTYGDDLFDVNASNLPWSIFLGGWGDDTLKISSVTDFTFHRWSYLFLWKVEKIDFSDVEGDLNVTLHRSMLRQAGNKELTFDFGESTTASLAAEKYAGWGNLFVEGTGTLQLSNYVNNYVHLTDGTSLEVLGGTQNDTIIAGNGGAILDGGLGNDKLVAGSEAGADEVRFSQGYGKDTVVNFDVAEDVVILDGYEVSDFASLLALATEEDGSTTIDFGDGNELILKDVSKEELSQENFQADWTFQTNELGEIIVSVDATAEEFNAAIAAAEDGAVFVLEAGNHNFDASIEIARDNITIKGEQGGDATVTFSMEDGTQGDGFIVGGEGSAYASTMPVGVSKGDTTLTLRDGHGFVAGDHIYVQQPNTQEYFDANGWDNVSIEEGEFRPFRESILSIESVDGNIITVTEPVTYDMEVGEGRYYTMDMVSGVTLSDFTVTYDLGETDKYDFTNTSADFYGTSAILLHNTDGAQISGIKFIDVASTALNLSSTINADVDDIYVSGSHNKGAGGNGYGVELHEAFNNNLTNLEIYDVRHSVILSAWHAEVNNNIHVLDTNRDINLHGSPDYDNQIQVDRAVLDYDTENDGDAWSIVSFGGINHAFTGHNANSVTFSVGIGSSDNDRMVGNDNGSVLVGGHAYDELIGGSSNDVIIGGTRRDIMTGNEGQDTFLLVMGDDLDRITDFEFGSDGDTLIFSANESVVEASDLRITESGDDVRIRYGSNSTVILENTALSDINSDNFQFDPDGNIGVDDYVVL